MLVDLNNILFRFIEIHKDLSFKGKHTGMFYGFLQTYCKYVNEHEPEIILVCDDGKPYKRNEIFPDYKKRAFVEDSAKAFYIHNNKEYVKEFLNMINISVWKEIGYEADDLEAHITKNFPNEEIIICSNDDDLYQLLTENVSLQRNKEFYTIESFKKEFPELKHPKDWILYKAMSGTHNGVKNIYNGLGGKTALKILSDEDKWKKFIKQYTQEIHRNIDLISLPFDYDLMDNIPALEPNKPFSLRKIENFLIREYGINVTENMLSAFSVLNGR